VRSVRGLFELHVVTACSLKLLLQCWAWGTPRCRTFGQKIGHCRVAKQLLLSAQPAMDGTTISMLPSSCSLY
jgi:hypothetical protein